MESLIAFVNYGSEQRKPDLTNMFQVKVSAVSRLEMMTRRGRFSNFLGKINDICRYSHTLGKQEIGHLCWMFDMAHVRISSSDLV